MYVVLAALIMAVSLSAFTPAETVPSDTDPQWFRLKPLGDPTVAADYNLLGASAPTDCGAAGDYVCAKRAMPGPNPNQPNLTTVTSTLTRITQ